MTANELADKLQELDSKLHLIELFKAAKMLRQQQAEIDAFKLNYYNTGYSLQLRDKDETIKKQQAEIEELRKFKAEIDAENKKLFESAQKANAIWDRATGIKNEK